MLKKIKICLLKETNKIQLLAYYMILLKNNLSLKRDNNFFVVKLIDIEF
jgi:hypothetical protein